MPVYLEHTDPVLEQHRSAALRAINDLPEHHPVVQATQQWCQASSNYDFYRALFNERIVGYVLLQGNEINALAVHHATRSRGVGQRMLSELKRLNPQVRLPIHCRDEWLNTHFERC